MSDDDTGPQTANDEDTAKSDGGDGGNRLALDQDELAGIVDLFGGLTRGELDRALSELAFKHNADPPADDRIDEAVSDYVLVAYDSQDRDSREGDRANLETEDDANEGEEAGDLLVPGPAAFPSLPEGAADLPHILDISLRSIDRGTLGRAVEERFRGDVARAVAAGDRESLERLLDVSYDLEAWGPVEMGPLRDRLDDALEE